MLEVQQSQKTVKFRQIYETKDFIFIEMEYIRGGTIQKLFNKNTDKSFKRTLMKNILTAVNFIHDKNYIHRDLKPDNVLLQERGRVSPEIKLCDFGLAAYKGLLDDESLD